MWVDVVEMGDIRFEQEKGGRNKKFSTGNFSMV